MTEPLIIAQNSNFTIALPPQLANRHGCITGATGTGKSVSLQLLAEAFSRIGTPVFLADVKGDMSGISQPGTANEKLLKRLHKLDLPEPVWGACPVTFWDIFGTQGHPIRATVSDFGPLLLARMMDLNDTQEGVLNLCFKVADDEGLLVLDLKDLRSMLQYVADNASHLRTSYGQVSSASIGAIQRSLLRLESEGAELFFGEPMLDIFDWIRTNSLGRGMVNILAADKLMQSPRLYAVFLLWMLADLYERLPEVGDLPQPKLVFFFDEAHLLFKNSPPALLEKVEQVVRLIRSKGVGVYFVTQNPADIPDTVLGQLGHRIQHALRAYTPRDQKAVKAAAQTMRPNPGLDVATAITELGVGEALISLLDAQGQPSPTERVWMYAPASRIGPATEAERQAIRSASLLGGKYDQAIDRESAYEILLKRTAAMPAATQHGNHASASQNNDQQAPNAGIGGAVGDFLFGSTGPRGGKRDGAVQSIAKSMMRNAANQLVRGILGSLTGKR